MEEQKVTATESAEPEVRMSLGQWFRSHPTGFWFFFWGEFAERCSYYGMRAILAKYMADQLGLGQADAATYMSFFIAACYFLPLLGGWIADNLFGKYWTIVGFSIPYILGHVILGFENYLALIIALCLLAMGSGVIKPNISTLMGLTYDQQRPGQTKLRSDAFAMFYFAINVGAAISQFAMPPIRSTYGYFIAFLFPAALMVVAFAIFAAGKRFYAVEVIQRTAKTPEQRAEQWTVLGRIFGLFFLVMFFWAIFDQSASTWVFFTEACMNRNIFGYEMDADQMQTFNPVLILILLPGITFLWRVLDRRGVHVRATDKMIAGFLLTTVCMGVMALAGYLAGVAELRPALVQSSPGAEDTVTVSQGDKVRKYTGVVRLDANAQKEFVATIQEPKSDSTPASTVKVKFASPNVVRLQARPQADSLKAFHFEAQAVVELSVQKEGEAEPTVVPLFSEGNVRLDAQGAFSSISESWFVDPDKQVTVWWLVIAYVIITIAEVLISVTGLELAYTAAPKHMTSFVTACWLLTVFLANFLINAPVTRLYTQVQPMMYFAALAVTMLVISVAFVFMAGRFNRAQAEADSQAAG